MKTIALMSLVILTGLLLVPTSQAAPSCCDPNQAQGQPVMFPSAPGVGGAFPVAPKSPYIQPVRQTTRATAPGPQNIQTSQPPTTYYRGPVIPAQAFSVNPPIAPVAAAYPAPSGSCCSGCGLNVPRQVGIPSESAPSCCAGRGKPAPPVSSCCAGKVKAAAPVPSCCAGKVKAAAPAPNCCAVGPKTAGSVPQFTKGARNAPYSYLPLHAQPAAIPAGFQSNMASAMNVPSSGEPLLRFGSLW